mmetsp:Transcript_10218/g.16464  ORF Transcript_10218/g.16464 Transcript_10218/m.16464 type:complete len:137 (-) Transcript_10218:24-434(-)|eukprot:jgi/Bigna1/126195/aug1.2_g903
MPRRTNRKRKHILDSPTELNDSKSDEFSLSDEEPVCTKKPKTEKHHCCFPVDGIKAPAKIPKDQKSCMTKEEFIEAAKELRFELEGSKFSGDARAFSSGSSGWYLGGKIPIIVNGKTLWCQVGMNVSVLGSKEWKE